MALVLSPTNRAMLLESLIRRAVTNRPPTTLTNLCQTIIGDISVELDTLLSVEATRLSGELNTQISSVQTNLTNLQSQVTSIS